MIEARQDNDWDHTSMLLALIANVHRNQKHSKPVYPRDFHPYAKSKSHTTRIDDLGQIRHMFPPNTPNKENNNEK